MARNGAGTYVLPAGNPVVTGTTISSTTTNNTFNDIGTALTQSISSDGQTTPTANLPMGGYNHTNVANATVRTQYATAGQVQDSAFTLLTSVSGTNAITATAALGMTAYVAGQRFSFIAAGTNTGATTLNINSIGATAVTKSGTTALSSGDIVSGAVYQVIYDGTEFQILNPTVPANVSSFSAGTTGLTPSTATTGAVTLAGTLAVANGGTGQATASAAFNALSPVTTTGDLIIGNGANSSTRLAIGTTGQVPVSNGTTLVYGSAIKSATAQASTSGTSIDFTSIPSWVKRITVMLNGVSTSGASSVQVQLGSGSVTTSGYISSFEQGTSGSSQTTGFGLAFNSASDARYGSFVLTLITGNTWISNCVMSNGGSQVGIQTGSIGLSGTLDRVRLTTVNGTDTFDAGTVNILYE